MSEANSIKILYMEDDRGLARLTERVLVREGFEIEIAIDGETGLSLYNQQHFDLVLVDYRMPGISGLEVIKIMMESKDPPPIIMVTGGGSEKTAVEAMKMGASDYMVKDVDGGYLELVPIIIEKVMKRHRMMQEKKEAEAARELLIQELDSFAHTVAHDLKNPLYSIRLNLDRLRDLSELSPESADNLINALDGGLLKMGTIIDELLLLATVRTEEIELEPLDMSEIIHEALNRLEHLTKTYNPVIEISSEFPNVMGHAAWIEEVWANYLSNAIKYGGTPPIIKIGYDLIENDMVKFWVQDNGEGLTETQQGKLFIPFSRMDTIRAQGHGLGLSIVERIIQKINGQTQVESQVGEGSRFSFTISLSSEMVS